MVHALFPALFLPVEDQLSATVFIDSSPLPLKKEFKGYQQKCCCRKGSYISVPPKLVRTIVLVYYCMVDY